MTRTREIPFVKMQGAGNDFVIIDHDPAMDYCSFARQVCHRHMGIGADGVMVLGGSSLTGYSMRIINADGSEAEMCGNGARCMAVHIARKFSLAPGFFTMETQAGKIQASVAGETASIQLSAPRDYRPGIELVVDDKKFTAHFINTGVPHAVIFVEGLGQMQVEGLGRLIRHHTAFAPQGTNVNFVERVDEGCVAVRTYERGVEGETLACGTGSVASALVAYLQASAAPVPRQGAAIRVVTKSGEALAVTFDLQVVDGNPVITHVWLKGSGRFIGQGVYYYPGPVA